MVEEGEAREKVGRVKFDDEVLGREKDVGEALERVELGRELEEKLGEELGRELEEKLGEGREYVDEDLLGVVKEFLRLEAEELEGIPFESLSYFSSFSRCRICFLRSLIRIKSVLEEPESDTREREKGKREKRAEWGEV